SLDNPMFRDKGVSHANVTNTLPNGLTARRSRPSLYPNLATTPEGAHHRRRSPCGLSHDGQPHLRQGAALKLFTWIHGVDMRRLHLRKVYCRCRKAWAYYKNEQEHEAVCNSYALIVGIDAQVFSAALERKSDMMSASQKLEAFLLPIPCSTVERVGRLAI